MNRVPDRNKDDLGLINHIALVLDASLSMTDHAPEVVRVADAEIAYLARRSRELDQETRVTVYVFSDDVRCVIYDKDVLRLPSIAAYYAPGGNTALVAATVQSQEDLAQTAQLYGDHAFLTYVLTDGEENVSRFTARFNDGHAVSRSRYRTKCTTQEVTRYLAVELGAQPDNWTVACLVPDQRGVHEAKKFGFPAENIAVWDTTSARGVEEVFASTIRTATDDFMVGRSRGVRGSRTLFAGGTDAVNSRTVSTRAGFRPLPREAYVLLDVEEESPIRHFVEVTLGDSYRAGSAFYELTKPEKIQPQKVIMVRNRKSAWVYTGPDARALLGLPDHEVRVRPEHNAEFQIFVQSTSVNRKLVPNTKLLVLT